MSDEDNKVTAEDIRLDLQRALKRLLWATVVLYAALGVFAVYVWHDNKGTAREAANVHTSLCAFKGDLQKRIKDSRDYLKEHPEGIPSLHISAGVIRNGIISQQKTVDSLKNLKCATDGG